MKSWTIREAKTALDWAKTSGMERCSIQELAAKLARSTIAIQQFLRREIPPGQRPWAEKPRWDDADMVAVVNECELTQSRSANAVRKLLARRVPQCVSEEDTSMDERDMLSIPAQHGMKHLVEVRQIQEVLHGHQPDDHRMNASKNGAQNQSLKGYWCRHAQSLRRPPTLCCSPWTAASSRPSR